MWWPPPPIARTAAATTSRFESSLDGFALGSPVPTLDEATFNVNAAGNQNVTLSYDLKAFDHGWRTPR